MALPSRLVGGQGLGEADEVLGRDVDEAAAGAVDVGDEEEGDGDEEGQDEEEGAGGAGAMGAVADEARCSRWRWRS